VPYKAGDRGLNSYPRRKVWFGRFVGRSFSGCGKGHLFCHSERSEESLFGLNMGKESFLGARRASERKKGEFFRSM
jgi:hypothetical protein